ncbi:MAG: hypothetical protein ACLR2C_01565 [Parasutterella excrementihominis]
MLDSTVRTLGISRRKGAGPGSFFADYAFAEGMAVNRDRPPLHE